jgi:hypothetical protein
MEDGRDGTTRIAVRRAARTAARRLPPAAFPYCPLAPVLALVHQRPHIVLDAQSWVRMTRSSLAGSDGEYTPRRAQSRRSRRIALAAVAPSSPPVLVTRYQNVRSRGRHTNAAKKVPSPPVWLTCSTTPSGPVRTFHPNP